MKNARNNTKQILTIVGIIVVVALVLWMIPTTILSPDRMLAKGEMYQKTGRTALALEIYKKAVESYPDNYEAHLHLGNALLEADEPELARVEFKKAVDLSDNSRNKFDAQLAMATMLISDNNYEKAESVLLAVQDPKPNKVKRKLAELYLLWGDEKSTTDKMSDALAKYKMAFKNYEGVDIESQQKVEDKVIRIYNEMALDYVSKKQVEKAIETLKESIAFVDNPSSHIKLAEIYKKQNKKDEAIEEYKKAFDIDTTGTSSLYLGELLVEKGVEFAQKNDMAKAKEYFAKAQEVNPSIVIPAEILYSVALNSIKTEYAPYKSSNSKYVPGISFMVSNKGKDKLTFLKAKVIFMDNEKVIGRAEETIASEKEPIPVKGSSKQISLTCPNPVDDESKSRVIQAKIYLAYEVGSEWQIARTLNITKGKATFVSATSSSTNSNSSSTKPEKPGDKPVTTTKPHGSPNVPVQNPTVAPVNPVANTNVQPIPVPVPVQPNSNPDPVALPPMNPDSN